jgi:hypothetical protein
MTPSPKRYPIVAWSRRLAPKFPGSRFALVIAMVLIQRQRKNDPMNRVVMPYPAKPQPKPQPEQKPKGH